MIKLKNTQEFRKYAKKKKVKYVKSSEDLKLNSGASEMDIELVHKCLYANTPEEQYIEDLKSGKRKPEISPNVSHSRVTDQELREDDEKLMDFLKSEQLDRIMTKIESEKKSSATHNPNETKNHHSKFAPSSQGVKSRKPIEDDFEIIL